MDDNTFIKFTNAVQAAFETPVTWIRKNVVQSNQQDYPWYHRQFRRVPTIDQCYTDDVACYYEANEQYKRDKSVDNNILAHLKRRQKDCWIYEGHNGKENCAEITETYEQATADWFVKYGEMGAHHDVRTALMKQKHRMLWERRYGPVGTGMNPIKAQE